MTGTNIQRTIQLDAPDVGELEKEFLVRAIDSGYVSTAGPFVAEFENAFSRYLGVAGAVSTQSGTAAIHVALHELGISSGDEVIVPALTFAATANPVFYAGATPVFVDVDLNTWNISPQEIEKAVSEKTKAIIPVHLYGNPCDMDNIMGIAKKYKLHVIEDATESLCATFGGRFTGTFGDLGCFSFNGNKTMTTGGGGMVAGNNKDRLDHIKFLVNQARDESRGYYHPEIGFNYRMTNLEAALGLAQMQRLDGFLGKKKMFNTIYREELGKHKSISFQKEYESARSSCWLTCIVFEEQTDIAGLQSELRAKGIPTRRLFMPLPEMPPYAGFVKTKCNNAAYLYERGLCLPGSVLNSEKDVRYVCNALMEVLG